MSDPSTAIPVADPGRYYRARRGSEILRAIEHVLEGGSYILGASVQTFEERFAQFLGVEECIGVGNGTDALALALKAVGVKPGDEVITVSHSAVATVAAIEWIGAVPVLIDIDRQRRCLDPDLIEGAVSSRTRAIVPVHLYGQPADMSAITEQARRFGLAVVEDCAQAHGAMIEGKAVGTFGEAAAFSFYPTKNLGAFGDGGAVVTKYRFLADQVRLDRQYGWKERYVSVVAGANSRLDEIQAAVLLVKLEDLSRDNDRRRSIASRFSHAIDGSSLRPPELMHGETHAMHLYVVETAERERFREWLLARGISSAVHYPHPIHLQPAYRNRIRHGSSLTRTEELRGRIVTLPLFPELTEAEVQWIVESLGVWVRTRREEKR
jgi:dTDP-4-amino-4,6-dideoxygalactose transaminase